MELIREIEYKNSQTAMAGICFQCGKISHFRIDNVRISGLSIAFATGDFANRKAYV